MGVLAEAGPKASFDVGGQPLIEYMIRFVRAVDPEAKLVIVGGYRYDVLQEMVGKIDPSVVVVENPNYTIQNLTSLHAALPEVEGSLLVCNADYIFTKAHAEMLSKNLEKLSVVGSRDLSRDEDDVMKMQTRPDGTLIEMSKKLEQFDSIYTGIFYIPEEIASTLGQTMEDIWAKYDQAKTTVEFLFPEFSVRGSLVHVTDIGKADWAELDTPDELEIARTRVVGGEIDFV